MDGEAEHTSNSVPPDPSIEEQTNNEQRNGVKEKERSVPIFI